MTIKLSVLHLTAPDGMPPLDGLSSDDRLLTITERSGLDVRRFTISSRADWNRALDALIETPDGPDSQVLLVQAHGKRVTKPTGLEPFNLLLAKETDLNDIYQTAIDLDEGVARLGGAARGHWLVVVDACGVGVRTRLDSPASSVGVAVLLATTPNGSAEAGERGGLLSQHFVDALASGFSEARTLRQVAVAARQGVINDTGTRRQTPNLKEIANAGFLDIPLRLVADADAHGSKPDLVGILLEASLAAALGPADLRALAAAASGTDSAEQASLRLLVLAAELLQTRTAEQMNALENEVLRCQSGGLQLDPRALARAKHIMGWGSLQGLGEAWTGAGHLKRALTLLQTRPNSELEAQIHDTLGTALVRSGVWNDAFFHYRASRTLKDAQGDRQGLEMTRQNLGWALLAAGAFEDGEAEFRTGVDACLTRLDQPPDGAHVSELTTTLESLAFHTYGLHSAMLIRGATNTDHDRLRRLTKAWWPLVERLPSWGSLAPTKLAALAETVGRGGLLRVDSSADPMIGGDADVWRAAALLVSEGTTIHATTLSQRLRELAGGQTPRQTALALAVASHIFHRFPSAGTTDVLSACVDEVRKYNRAVDPVTTYPWFLGGKALRIETENWPSHHFLGVQRAITAAPSVVAHPSATEQFIQLLAWYSGLLMCLEGKVSADSAWSAITKDCAPGRPFMLTPRVAVGFAKEAAELSTTRGSSWGVAMRDAWTSLSPFDEYESLDSFFTERNAATHRAPLREAALREMLERHQTIIRRIAVLIQDTEPPSIEGTGRSIDDSNKLETVRLSRPGRRTFDCGLLLGRERGASSRLCIPHFIDKGWSTSAKTAGLAAEYVVYDVDFPSEKLPSHRVILG